MVDNHDFLRNVPSSYQQNPAVGQQLFSSDSATARTTPPPISGGLYTQSVGAADMSSQYAQSVPQMSYSQVPLQVPPSQPAPHADQSHDLHSIYGMSQGFAGMPTAFQSVAQPPQAPPQASQSRPQYSMSPVQQDYTNIG